VAEISRPAGGGFRGTQACLLIPARLPRCAPDLGSAYYAIGSEKAAALVQNNSPESIVKAAAHNLGVVLCRDSTLKLSPLSAGAVGLMPGGEAHATHRRLPFADGPPGLEGSRTGDPPEPDFKREAYSSLGGLLQRRSTQQGQGPPSYAAVESTFASAASTSRSSLATSVT